VRAVSIAKKAKLIPRAPESAGGEYQLGQGVIQQSDAQSLGTNPIKSAWEASMALDSFRTKLPFISAAEGQKPWDDDTRGHVSVEGPARPSFQHSESPNDDDVRLPADVGRDLARILARALVQQFRADMALPVGSLAGADAGPVPADAIQSQKD
jgi:hypothetical protein